MSSERAHDRLGVERAVEQRAGGGERVVAAGADAHDAGLGLEHVAGAGEHQRDLRVGDDHHGLEPAQIAVGAPVLGELDRGAGELAGILLELGFQPLEQREGVGGGAGEAADHVALAEAAHLLGVGLDDGLADRDLAVAADHDACRPCGRSGWWCRARGRGRGTACAESRGYARFRALQRCNDAIAGRGRSGEGGKPLIKGAR